MARRNRNARPYRGPSPTGHQVRPGTRNRGYRDAAKHIPSRVTSRMWSRVHAITTDLEEATGLLARVDLPQDVQQNLAVQIADCRVELAALRRRVHLAGRDRVAADRVKADLSNLAGTTRLLVPAITALVNQHRLAKSGDVDLKPTLAAYDVLGTLDDRPGRLSTAIARLRAATAAAAA